LDTFGGGPALTFSSADSHTKWTLTGAGSLNATVGASINYIPPSTIPVDAQVTVVAADNGASATETITLHAPKLNPGASAATWFVGDAPITLNVSPQFTDATPTWTVIGGGSLDSTQGDTVHYTPPAVTADTTASLSASAGGHTESVNISLKPAVEKMLQLGDTSIQAGNGTVTLTVPSTIAHQALTWSTALGTVTPSADGNSATYTPPVTLASPTVATLTASDGISAPFIAMITVTPSATLSVSPPFSSTSAVTGAPVSLTATIANSTATVQWAVVSGTGTVTPSTGSTVSYVPDLTNTTSNTSAVVQATLGSLTQTVTITLNFHSTSTFNAPRGLVIDGAGNLFVADTANNLIRKITPAGVVSTLAGSGTAGATDGTGTGAMFNSPKAITIDTAGNLYVADTGNNKIREVTQAGAVTTIAGSGVAGSNDATGVAATFNDPEGIAFVAGNLFVADTGNDAVRQIVPAGAMSAVTTKESASVFNSLLDGPPAGIATDGGSSFYVTVPGTGDILLFQGTSIVEAHNIGLTSPTGIVADGGFNLRIVDEAANTVFDDQLENAVIPLAGNSTAGSVDGVGANARFNAPAGIAIDSTGNLYIADTGNNEIRMITPTGFVMTIAGDGTSGAMNGTALVRQ
jgi:sugar lactone lactonase YvrE